jgi:hypothetical protein
MNNLPKLTKSDQRAAVVKMVNRTHPPTRPQPVFFANATGALRPISLADAWDLGASSAAKVLAALAAQGDNASI